MWVAWPRTATSGRWRNGSGFARGKRERKQRKGKRGELDMYTIQLFAGAGGGILADLLLGHTPIAACEIEEYPRSVLIQRQIDGLLPVFPVWDNIETMRSDNPECSDAFKAWKEVSRELAICGGFP
jgi:site-specific DNA-cytosine methylase